jgi:hypothetical protein
LSISLAIHWPGAIPHDTIQDISISPSLSALSLSLHLPGLEWSEAVEIAQMKAFNTFKLQDKEGRRLKISLAQEYANFVLRYFSGLSCLCLSVCILFPFVLFCSVLVFLLFVSVFAFLSPDQDRRE